MQRLVASCLAPSLVLAVACSDAAPPGTMRYPDASVTEPDSGVAPTGPSFVVESIAGVGPGAPRVGDNATLSLDGQGRPAIAFGSIATGSTDYEVWYGVRGDDGAWATELAVRPGAAEPMTSGQIIGLGLAHVAGVPHVVYLGGDGDDVVLTPFPTDLMLATKSGGAWSERTLADRSSDAPGDCPGTQDTCNFGNVVGSHASIAARPGGGGFTVVYRDTHGGFARNDLALSDVELYGEGGPVMRACVDPVRGGGAFANVTYTAANELVLAYDVETPGTGASRVGVWTAASDAGEWTLTKVSDSQAASKIALATAPDGTIWMAFNHADDVTLVAGRSTDGGKTWTTEVVDDSGKTGLYPSLAIDGEGRPVISYGYCGRTSDVDCPGTLGARSVVKLARLEGSAWKTYPVDDGQGFGRVGLFTSIAVTSDGKLGIAFVDDANGDLLYAREE
jgi:hypothetical protein